MAANANKGLESFQNDLTVSLIATGRAKLTTCRADEELTTVLDQSRQTNFDFYPVTEPAAEIGPRAPILGLIELAGFKSINVPNGLVGEYMQPLSDHNLIGADASILDFIRCSELQRCRLVVSGSEISGLVSLSDLQRLPVRAALFAMVTHLEMTMTSWIRSNSGDWLQKLSTERQEKVRSKVKEAKLADAYVDSLLFTEFGDKVTIIKRSQNFCWAKASFKDDLAQVQSLRNSLAHASDYACTPAQERQVCKTVNLIDSWICRLGESKS